MWKKRRGVGRVSVPTKKRSNARPRRREMSRPAGPGMRAGQNVETRTPAQPSVVQHHENQMRVAQAMFERLFEATPDANLLVAPDGRIVAANQQAETLFGYSRGELLGQPVELLVPEEKREGHAIKRSEFHRSLHNSAAALLQESRRLDQNARCQDGSVLPVEVTLTPVPTGRGTLVLCAMRDIRPRIQRENALRAHEDIVQMLQEVATAANEASSIQAAFQYSIERICQYLNWPLAHAFLTDETDALTPLQLWVEYDHNNYTVFRAVSDALRFRPGYGLPGKSFAERQPVWMNDIQNNSEFARSSEARMAGLNTGLAVPVMTGKEISGVLEFFHTEDIPPDSNLMAVLPQIGLQLGRVVERYRAEEALRKSAAQLRMVITNLPVVLSVISRDGRLIMLEGKGVAALGVNPQDLIGRNILKELDTRPDLLEPIRRAMAGEEVHSETIGNNDSVFETYYTPYYDVNWAVDGLISLSFDISERKRMAAELDEMKHRLMESGDNEQARLAQQLHDGPLQDLYGAFYQIQEIKAGLDDSAQEVANRALQTIQAVNATLRVIVGELHPNTLVHLGLQRAIRSHAERMQDRLDNVTIHLDLEDDEQSLPHGLRLGLYRVYQQLIANAISHAQARHIWVRLRLPSTQVILEVQDNGIGFQVPEHWIELVRQGKFGLVSTLERVQGLNGTLELNGNTGQGTLARVVVPRP